MKQWFSARELAGLPGLPGTERRVRSRAEREGWQSRKRQKGKGLEYHRSSLPAATQLATILESESAGAVPQSPPPAAPAGQTQAQARSAGLWAAFERKPGSIQREARRRLEIVRAYHRLAAEADAAREAGKPYASRSKIVATLAGKADTGCATVRNWVRAVRGIDASDWLPFLAPRWTGRTATAECSPEAWDFFKADYLRLEKPAAKAVYERLKRAAKAHGWRIPSLRTLDRRLHRELPKQVIILAREGSEALERMYPAQERDRSVLRALEAVNADGHRFDVFVRWPGPDGDEIVRPIMVAWQDVYSGKILAFRVDKTENKDSVRLSFGDVVERYGIPDHAYLDNGRGFAAKHLTGGSPTRFRFKLKDEDPLGIFPLLGITVHWCTPYHGQAKPIERAFRDLCEYVARHPALAGAYTGNNPNAKPENYGSRAVPLDEFLAVLAQEIAAHNARSGRRGGVCAGRSFDAVFSESYERSPIRKATAQQRRLWLLAAEGVRVQKGGEITISTDRRNRYWDARLAAHAGEQVVLRFDPQRLHDPVHVYALDGAYLGEAACIEAAGFHDQQAARAHGRNKRRFLKAQKQALEAARRMDALDAAKAMPEIHPEKTPDARIVRPTRPAVELRDPVPEPQLAPEHEQARRDLLAEAKDGVLTLEERRTESQRDRFRRCVRLLRRAMGDGEPLTPDELDWATAYRAGLEWKVELAAHLEWDLHVDGEPVDAFAGDIKKGGMSGQNH